MDGVHNRTWASQRAHAAHDSAWSGSGMDVDKDKDEHVEDSARLIRGLEEEVRELTEKVASASQRFADYENEIRVLQAQVRQERRRNEAADQQHQQAQQEPQEKASGLTRGFGSFMHARRAPPSLAPTDAVPPIPPLDPTRERELEAQLTTERAARVAAQENAAKVSGEIEELTGSLFEQANGMVAEERRENARLRERVAFLEARDAKVGMRVQGLEERERERRGRLERLERAQERLERVGGLLKTR